MPRKLPFFSSKPSQASFQRLEEQQSQQEENERKAQNKSEIKRIQLEMKLCDDDIDFVKSQMKKCFKPYLDHIEWLKEASAVAIERERRIYFDTHRIFSYKDKPPVQAEHMLLKAAEETAKLQKMLDLHKKRREELNAALEKVGMGSYEPPKLEDAKKASPK
jgi:hypothetical protein